MITPDEAYARLVSEIYSCRESYNPDGQWEDIEDEWVDGGDTERVHEAADKIMLEIIRQHGFDKFADLFSRLYKWYS